MLPSGSATWDRLTRRTLEAAASAEARARRASDGGAVVAGERVGDGDQHRDRPESYHDQERSREDSLHDSEPPWISGLGTTDAEGVVGATEGVATTSDEVRVSRAGFRCGGRGGEDGGNPDDGREDDRQTEKSLAHGDTSSGVAGHRGDRNSRLQRSSRGRATHPAWSS
jgi:hypothetical protein